jgi:hypothetical protein
MRRLALVVCALAVSASILAVVEGDIGRRDAPARAGSGAETAYAEPSPGLWLP